MADALVASGSHANMVDQPYILQPATGTLTYTGPELRMPIDAIYATEGVIGTADFKVGPRVSGGVNDSVDIAAGFAVVTGDTTDATYGQGKFLVKSVGIVNVQMPNATPGNIHRVFLRVRDDQATATGPDWTIEVFEGSGGAPAALPGTALQLAMVTIGAGGTVAATNIVSSRIFTGPPRPVYSQTQSTATTLAHATSNSITFQNNSHTYDPDSMYSGSGVNFTIKRTGWHQISAQLMLDDHSDDGHREIWLTVNGTTTEIPGFYASAQNVTQTAVSTVSTPTRLTYLTEGDTVFVRARQNSTGAISNINTLIGTGFPHRGSSIDVVWMGP